MTRILLTGGSGFIATHVLNILLEHGHSVVTTVRSKGKAEAIKNAHPDVNKERLDFFIVEDIAVEGAFDEAVKSNPPFEAVVHTSSPYHFNVTNTKKDLLDPAVIGTTGLLKSIYKSAPTVKRVVITSSFAAIVDGSKGSRPGYVYSEKDWNPITEAEAENSPMSGYRASKTFAEKASWEFVEREKTNFTLATINPPLVFGPILHQLSDLSNLNTSNQRVRDLIHGKYKNEIPPSGVFLWADVRDVALAHVRAAELPEAGNQRFFVTAGYFSNREIADVIKEGYPDLADKLPGEEVKGDFNADAVYKYDNSKAKEVLGITFRSFKECILDTVKSLQAVGT